MTINFTTDFHLYSLKNSYPVKFFLNKSNLFSQVLLKFQILFVTLQPVLCIFTKKQGKIKEILRRKWLFLRIAKLSNKNYLKQ